MVLPPSALQPFLAKMVWSFALALSSVVGHSEQSWEEWMRKKFERAVHYFCEIHHLASA